MELFSQMFGNEFFKNAVICFSKFGYDKVSLRNRQKGTKSSEEKLKFQMTKEFKKLYEFDL